jgi:hypothetical protein
MLKLKLNQNDIDATVLEAINQLRARAYGADVNDTGSYPAITTTDQAELRKVIRRERKVELRMKVSGYLTYVVGK